MKLELKKMKGRIIEIWDSRNKKIIYYPQIFKKVTYKFLFFKIEREEWVNISRTHIEKRAKEILIEYNNSIKNPEIIFKGAINIW